MAGITEGNWCHIWNPHMERWEVRVAAAFGARVAIVVAPNNDQAYADVKLLAASKLLLELVREYGSKCEACGGSAESIRNDRGGDPEWDYAVPCSKCSHIWEAVNKAEVA